MSIPSAVELSLETAVIIHNALFLALARERGVVVVTAVGERGVRDLHHPVARPRRLADAPAEAPREARGPAGIRFSHPG